MNKKWQVSSENIVNAFARNEQRCLVKYVTLANIISFIFVIFTTIFIGLLFYSTQYSDYYIFPNMESSRKPGPVFFISATAGLIYVYYYIIRRYILIRKVGRCAIEFDGLILRVAHRSFDIKSIVKISMIYSAAQGRMIYIKMITGEIEEVQLIGFVSGLKDFFQLSHEEFS